MSSAAARRLLIASKSNIQKAIDPRPRCADCGAVLTRRDFTSYWDDDSPAGLIVAGMSQEEMHNAITPRICEECSERSESE